MAKTKFYAVKVGQTPGVYNTWDECKKMVHGYPGAIYKSFPTAADAMSFVKGNGQGEKTNAQGKSAENNEPTDVEQLAETYAYVDGSYNVSTGEYGCGVVFFHKGEESHIAKKGTDEKLAEMRNVAGEILGSELAMRKALEVGAESVVIYHDYQGIASWCLGEWKTNKEGTKQYKEFYDSIASKLHVEFRKVKGHSGDTYNDLADELAKSTIF